MRLGNLCECICARVECRLCTCQAVGQRGLNWLPAESANSTQLAAPGQRYDNFSSSSSSSDSGGSGSNSKSNSNDTNHNHHKAVAIAVDYDELLPRCRCRLECLPLGYISACPSASSSSSSSLSSLFCCFAAAAFLAKVYQRGKILTFLCAFHFGAFSWISQEFAFCTLIKRTRTH